MSEVMDPGRTSHPSTSERLLALPRAKREALNALLQRGKQGLTATIHGDVHRDLPMSYGQQRLWFLDQWEQGTAAYNIPAPIRLETPVNIPALRQALAEIVRRHSSLRAVFRMGVAGPVQDICAASEMDLFIVPFTPRDGGELTSDLIERATRETRRPFDLAHGPLFRAVLFLPDGADALLLMTMHHIVSDGWSLGILFYELKVLYAAFSSGAPSPLPALSVQYSDFAVWQHTHLTNDNLSGQLAYWRKQLANAPALRLPTDRPAPSSPTLEGAQYPVLADERIREKLQQINRREGVTMNMTLLAAFLVLLYRYSGQEDIVVGLPVAGRDDAATERLIGFFVNFLVVRSDASGLPTFVEFLHRVRRTVLDGFDNREVPFERIVAALHPDRQRGPNPMFQVTFQLFAGAQSANELNQPLAGAIDIDKGTSLFDLAFNLWETTRGIEGRIEYRSELFDRDTIARMAGHFVVLLENIVRNADCSIADLPMLPAEERKRVLFDWNTTFTPTASDGCIHQLIEQHAERHPDDVAVRAGGNIVSYATLNASANRIAHMLMAEGVGADTAVAVRLRRSPELIATWLAVLKASAVYVPIDPSYPAERIELLLRDSGAAIVITDDPGQDVSSSGLRLLTVGQSVNHPARDPSLAVRRDQLAYIVYTSGSTGTPKGVEVEHGALSNLVAWHRETYHVSRRDRATQIASVSFDAAAWEIWPHLAAGACIAIADDETRADPARLLKWLVDEAITICFLPTPLAESVLRLPLPAGLALRELLTGGDRLRVRPADALPFRVINHYGPTENTVVATSGVVEPGGMAALPTIGRPIRNTRVYILDRRQQPVPIGVPGEIYLAGMSLARGYHSRPDLTSERFLPDAFSSAPADRMYRTGDVARWLPDGSIDFLGRSDRQLKIRGYRIEAGEVEAVLARHPGVRDVVVTSLLDARGDSQLVGYVVLRSDHNFGNDMGAVLRAFLVRSIPQYMIPAAFVAIDALPSTPNGKIDIDALPPPERPHVTDEQREPAIGDVEHALVAIWQQILHVDQVGVHDDFFADHGGHSLLTIALVARIRDLFHIELPLRTIFEAPTIRRLAECIQSSVTLATESIPDIPRRGRQDQASCSFAQERLWFLDRLIPGRGLYNIPAALRLRTPLDAVILQKAVDVLAMRHEALRTTFHAVDGAPVQRISPVSQVQVTITDLQTLSANVREGEALRLARIEARAPFQLDAAALLRVGLLQMDEGDQVLLVTMHHIIADGSSVDIFFRELSVAYEACARGEKLPLPPLPIQYADYAEWQRVWLRGADVGQQLEYWQTALADPPVLELPTDRPRPAMPTYHGGREFFYVDADVTSRLKEMSHEANATLFMTLVAAFQTLLFRYSGQHDILLGTITAGRDRLEIEGVIGLFVNTLPLRTDMSGNPTFSELLTRVRDVALSAYGHADVPFEKLVELLQPERDLSRNPLVQVIVQLFSGPASPDGGTAVRQLDVDRDVSTFDLSLDMWELDGGLKGRLEYSTDLFEALSIARMSTRFQTLLESIARDPGTRIEQLALTTDDERRRLIEWSKTTHDSQPDGCVHHLFEASVAEAPNAVAVIHGDEQITYAQLDARAELIANHLYEAGVRPETIVALCLTRSIDAVAAILGILKCGGTYLPLDTSHPVARLESLVRDAGVHYAISSGKIPSPLKQTPAIDLTRLKGAVRRDRCETGSGKTLAYILYTSGSTGQPKGVMVEHASLVNHALAIRERFQLTSADRVLQFASLAFDVAAEEIFPTLLVGGTLVIPPDESLMDPRALGAYITGKGVTVANLPSAYWHEWVDALDVAPVSVSLRLMVIGSERVDPARVSAWFQRIQGRPVLVNAYGATEATITSLTAELSPAGSALADEVPVGRPLSNVTAYILDGQMQPVPVGITGDLYVGGAGLARGYLGAESVGFLPSPFGAGRLFRTGDRARYLEDGEIVLRGRLDLQIKVRGFRIEPSEIEAVIKKHLGVREAVILKSKDQQLVAYIVPAHGAVPLDLAAFLRERLPDYMVPTLFIGVLRLPFTSRGKLNTAALPAADRMAPSAGVTPESHIERVIASVWEEALQISHATTEDNFFELGGHSLLLLRVHSRLEAALHREIAIVDLFRYPNIRSLAHFLSERRQYKSTPDGDGAEPGLFRRSRTKSTRI